MIFCHFYHSYLLLIVFFHFHHWCLIPDDAEVGCRAPPNLVFILSLYPEPSTFEYLSLKNKRVFKRYCELEGLPVDTARGSFGRNGPW